MMISVRRVKEAGLFLMAVCCLGILVGFPQACADGIRKGLGYAGTVLIPSLFPYMVLSGWIMRSGADRLLNRGLAALTRHVFRLPEDAGAAIVLSMIGGFPVGARCIALLYKQHKISAEQARRMLCFCVCPGPAFMLTAVGVLMLHNRRTGWILYLSQIVSCVILGIISGLTAVRKQNEPAKQRLKSDNETGGSFITYIIEASSDGAQAIIVMTALVILFSMVYQVTESSGILMLISRTIHQTGADSRFVPVLTASFLEVTGGCDAVKKAGMPLYMYALCVGFGGMCVHFQIFSMVRELSVSRGKYLLFRAANALISAGITYLICCFDRPTADVFAVSGGAQAQVSAVSLTGSMALVVMSVVFVLSLHSGRTRV